MIINNKILFYLVSFIILGLVFFYKIRIVNKEENFLKKSNTDSFRGIAITCIVFHHIVQRINNPGILVPFRGIGYLFVSCFFFLSGYGLVLSYKKKESYLKSFFTTRLSKIYIPFIFINFINLLINIFCFNIKYTLIDFICRLVGIKLMSSAMWYIVVIIFWYCIFYLTFKHIKENNVCKALILVSIVYYMSCYFIGLSKNWYDTAFIFPIGVFVGLNQSKISNICKKYYFKIFIGTLVIFIVSFLMNYGKVDLKAIVFRNIASITFTIIFIMILIKIDISRNKIATFIGSISFEVFLIHDRMLGLLNKSGYTSWIRLISYIGVVIISSYYANKIMGNLNKLICNNLKVERNEKQFF